ncbi:EscU/YscU/HrcU family type III secretion system export apparatus switch protein [Buchnera aphidicola (Mollitrichosiphum nigrofasciatum)]|uniref:EscU/YscU/HrcU family type III secretion system export apparatus switch protein n=1 Tax=Buchnera aphidicola TaxID=9 RepID=UPI0031B879A3
MCGMNSEQKTEKPTSYRLKKNREIGNNIYFKELNTLVILLTIIAYFWIYKKKITSNLINVLQYSLKFDLSYFGEFFYFIFIHFLYIFCIIFLVNIFFPLLQGHKFVKFNKLIINFKNISLKQRLMNIFSFNKIYESLNCMMKILLMNLIYIIYCVILYEQLFILSVNNTFKNTISIYTYIVYVFYLLLLFSYLPIVIFDIISTKINYFNLLSMTKTEVKEEKKFLEGNDLNKKRIFKNMHELIENNNIKNFLHSDIFFIDTKKKKLISIRYNIEKNNLQLIFKISGLIIFKIKKLAKDNKIPIVRSSHLIKILYKNLHINQKVPDCHAGEIIKIINWIKIFNKWKKYGGLYPKKPSSFVFHVL